MWNRIESNPPLRDFDLRGAAAILIKIVNISFRQYWCGAVLISALFKFNNMLETLNITRESAGNQKTYKYLSRILRDYTLKVNTLIVVLLTY